MEWCQYRVFSFPTAPYLVCDESNASPPLPFLVVKLNCGKSQGTFGEAGKLTVKLERHCLHVRNKREAGGAKVCCSACRWRKIEESGSASLLITDTTSIPSFKVEMEPEALNNDKTEGS